MYSSNEWGTLKKVIVGDATGAKIPSMDISLRTVNYADKSSNFQPIVGDYPRQVVEEANEDLEIFCNFLKTQQVEVVRPDATDPTYYNYCPRDSVLVYKNCAIGAPMPVRARHNEYLAFKDQLHNLTDLQQHHADHLYNIKCVGNPDILALTESSAAFDAANVIRANNDLLYLVSNSGNQKGADLLQSLLGSDVKVHTLSGVYSYMHIDSTIAFLREGLLLINPDRITNVRHQLPAPFNKWDYIVCPEPFDIGHYPKYCNSSKWVNMNLLSVSPDLVVLEKHQTSLARELKKYRIDSALLPMRHQRTLGGGFHCVTLDLDRNVD